MDDAMLHLLIGNLLNLAHTRKTMLCIDKCEDSIYITSYLI